MTMSIESKDVERQTASNPGLEQGCYLLLLVLNFVVVASERGSNQCTRLFALSPDPRRNAGFGGVPARLPCLLVNDRAQA